MANGVSVLGKYESTTGARCPNAATTIAPQTAEGVTFPSSVALTTVLDGVRVTLQCQHHHRRDGRRRQERASSAMSRSQHAGGQQILRGQRHQRRPGHIARSHIDAGTGSVESIAVRAVGATVSVEDNCALARPHHWTL